MRKTILNLNDFVENILARLSRLKATYLIALCIGVNLILVTIFSQLLFPGISNSLVFFSLTEELITAVVLAPVIETYLVQGFILRKAYTLSGNNKFIAILVSALVFGIAHIYPSPPIALKAFLAGFLYATLFFAIQKKKKNPLLFVILAHSLYNLAVVCLNHFKW